MSMMAEMETDTSACNTGRQETADNGGCVEKFSVHDDMTLQIAADTAPPGGGFGRVTLLDRPSKRGEAVGLAITPQMPTRYH